MIRTCAHTAARSSSFVPLPCAECVRHEVGDGRPRRRVVLVQAQGDARGVPEHERDDDAGDQRAGSDRPRPGGCRRSAWAAGSCGSRTPSGRPRTRARRRGRRGTRTSPAEPSHGSVESAVDDADHRHDDRRQEDDEAPEDGGVHDPGQRGAGTASSARARRRPRCGRAAARRRSAAPACPCARAGRAGGPAVRRRPRRRRATASRTRPAITHAPRRRLISAVIAGTTSCRSPITA